MEIVPESTASIVEVTLGWMRPKFTLIEMKMLYLQLPIPLNLYPPPSNAVVIVSVKFEHVRGTVVGLCSLKGSRVPY